MCFSCACRVVSYKRTPSPIRSDVMCCYGWFSTARSARRRTVLARRHGVGETYQTCTFGLPEGAIRGRCQSLVASALSTGTRPKGMSSKVMAGCGACLPGHGHCMGSNLHIRKDHSQPPYSLFDALRRMLSILTLRLGFGAVPHFSLSKVPFAGFGQHPVQRFRTPNFSMPSLRYRDDFKGGQSRRGLLKCSRGCLGVKAR